MAFTPGFVDGVAKAVNDGGTVAVGFVRPQNGDYYASIWTQATGMMPLVEYLALRGVTVPAGHIPTICTGISADGNTIVGYTGQFETGPIRGFIATIPEPWVAPLFGLLLAMRRRRR